MPLCFCLHILLPLPPCAPAGCAPPRRHTWPSPQARLTNPLPPPPLLSRLRTTQKAYLAITQGVPQAAAFSVDAPIGAHGGIKEARAVGGADAKPATTGVCAGWVR